MNVNIRYLPIALLILVGSATANPDVWVRSALTYHLEDGRVSGFSYRWRFDEYFSSRNIAAYDADGDGRLDADEVGRLRPQSFDPLAGDGYHVHAWQGNQPIGGLAVTDFDASTDGTVLVFDFDLSLPEPADARDAPVSVSLRDAENVIDFKFVSKEFLKVDGSIPAGCKFQLGRGAGVRAGHRQVVTFKCGE